MYLFMKLKGNPAWRSRNGQMIKARQIDQIIIRDCYVRLLFTQNYAGKCRLELYTV